MAAEKNAPAVQFPEIPDPLCLAPAAIEAKSETVGVGKAGLKLPQMFVLAMLAGFFIGMGGLLMLLVKADTTLPFAASQLIGGACFSLGLLCVIVAGAELFTGNALMITAKASGKISWAGLLRNWGVVYVGNLAGALLLVFVVSMCDMSGMNGGGMGNAMIATAANKINLPWLTIFFRGIMCNILVCLAVWMGFAGKTVIDKVFTTILPVMAFVALGFEHCIANMFFLPMGMATLAHLGDAYTGTAAVEVINLGGVLWNISAATLGNIVGGMVLVGLAYWFAYRKKAA